jgi:hypothetical protein
MMSDATERARLELGRISQPCVADCGAPMIYLALQAALDYIEALKQPQFGCTCGCGRRFYSVVLRDHPSTTDFHAESERRFEEAIGE